MGVWSTSQLSPIYCGAKTETLTIQFNSILSNFNYIAPNHNQFANVLVRTLQYYKGPPIIKQLPYGQVLGDSGKELFFKVFFILLKHIFTRLYLH